MKKYQLGALAVSDKGLQDTKEEIVIELIDRMQKYVAEGKAAYENRDYTEEQKLNAITNLCGRFCGLAEFLQITMGIDVRRADGLLCTQEMFNHFHWLGRFLRSLPVLEAPWDTEFQKRYCSGCVAENCDACPNERFRNNPEWWLSLEADSGVAL